MFKLVLKLFVFMAMFTPVIASAITYDDFSAPLKWTSFSYGYGMPYSIQTNGKLEINIPSNSTGASFGAGYTSLCNFHGNFDVQVDYELINFPEANGVRVGITAGNVISQAKWGSGVEVTRNSWSISENRPFTEAYITNINHNCCHDVPTSDRAGKLRIKRKANLLSGYYFDNISKQWSLISANTLKLDDTSIEIGAWSHGPLFSAQPIKITFDNVVINKGSLVGASCSVK